VQDEESLVRRAKQRDQKAFGELYEQHFDRIYRYVALRIGDKTEAEDMTQQIFLKALQSISSFQWKRIPFAAWLFRIAHNQVVDHLRKRNKQAAVLPDESLLSSDNNPQLLTERRLDTEQLLLATKRLTEAQRQVISLRFTSELSIAQVAKIIGKSQGAVKALQHSGIIALRKILVVSSDEEV
jgi:RNA polymerase sigma-70 factor (ECF subfamily)